MTSAQAAFLPVDSFAVDDVPHGPPPDPPTRSPFLSLYEGQGLGEAEAPARDAFAKLVDSLYDDEFEQSMAAAHAEGRAFHDAQLAAGVARPLADERLRQHFEPLLRESAAMVDALGARFAPQESAGLQTEEVDNFVDSYTPTEPLTPAFEQLFGKLLKKVGGVVRHVASKAWQGVERLGLAPVLRLIKSKLLAFLRAAIGRVIGRLPPKVQPAARLLARRLGVPVREISEAEADETAEGSDPLVQQLLDEQLASSLLATDEADAEHELQAGGADAESDGGALAQLEDARERFVQQLQGLREGESPEPALEQFLPAILPALRVASRLIGHGRLEKLLAQLLTPLVARLVGPGPSGPLSQAIADAGMKLLGMELSEDETTNLAAPALAATVEETVARLAAMPADALQDSDLLEALTLESFEAAAAANLPGIFSEETYRRRPELLEGGVAAAWVPMPLRHGPRRYKRCTRAFALRLTPYMTSEVETFEGAPLADVLHDQMGLPEGEALEAELHLFEALPGSTLLDIARGERETLGPSWSDQVNAEQLQPLTL
jgi:hypothetical protein